MKHLIKLSLTALAVSTLVACSSSKSETSQTTVTDTKTATTATTPKIVKQPIVRTPTTPVTQPTTSSPSSATSGGKYGDAFVNGKFVGVNSHADIPEKLVVEGKTIVLRTPGIYSGGFNTSRGNVSINGVTRPSGAVSGYLYTAEFGYIDGVPFYQGKNPTTTLPKGTATYIGDAVYAKNGQFTAQYGGVNLKVNFDSKTVSGTLFKAETDNRYLGNIAEVKLQDAKITDNGFTGKAVQGTASAELKGKFFGTAAEEVAGAYSNGTISGAFGAKKTAK